MTFKELGLKQELVAAITDLGFETPTPIQEEAIPYLLDNPDKDLIALAQTGTGKTAAFSLPILNQIEIPNKEVQMLILCPTRELCLQIARDIETYTSKLRSLKTVAVYGGTSISQQKKQLKKGTHIVVGTPGRTLDLIRQKSLNVRNIQWLVLDEADEMLSMGFQDDLESILSTTPRSKQNLFFSATMPKNMKSMVKDFMQDPHKIQMARQNLGAKNVEHHYYVAHNKNRYKTLQRLVDANPNIYGIIFCRTRRETQEVADRLMQMDYNADTIHGDLSQNQRDAVMKSFKKKTIQLLVATDVAARGIDVDDLTHVINYQLPDDPEVYVHRSGRTGRAGKKGISICIIHNREGRRLKSIEKMIGKQFLQKDIPTGQEICEAQIGNFLQEIKNHEPNSNLIEEYWPKIEEQIGELDAEEIINRLLSLEIKKFTDVYKNAKDLNQSQPLSFNDVDDGKRRRNKPSNYVGYTINSGSKARMNPKRLITLVNEQTDSNDIEIGDIIIKMQTTYFEVGEADASRVEDAFSGLEFNGKPALEKADRKPERTQGSKRNNRSRSSDGGGRRGGGRHGRSGGNNGSRSSRGGNKERRGDRSRGRRR